jgi:methionyl-tRNA formyltransferase
VVASFTRILKPATLSLAPLGVLNVHPSLLPKYRGADPIFWAMVKDEKATGVTIHWMDAGVDTGPILAQCEVSIAAGMDAIELTESLTRAGVELLNETLDQIENRQAAHKSQDECNATYFPPAMPEFRTIHWEDGADTILRLIRASRPYGGALALLGSRPVKIISAKVIKGSRDLLPGEVLRHDDKWIEVACQDAILRISVQDG